MPLKIDSRLTPHKLVPMIERMFEVSAGKIANIALSWKPADGTPVFTVKGRYTTRGWTEWTQGFQYGSALLQFDATDEKLFLGIGRRNTIQRMAAHVSHMGVHDHGFNNISTYGNLLRLMREGRIPFNASEKNFYELALKVSGAVQAARWTKLADNTGFIHSFNGPHSLFVDTLRSCRSLAVAHQLGHVLMGEQDAKISLLDRLIQHALNTARRNVYYDEGRDAYDVRGRVAHETIFNTASGHFRSPNSQQGYSPFSTWTRGLAWAICGFAEQLEFIRHVPHQLLGHANISDYRDEVLYSLGPDWESKGNFVATMQVDAVWKRKARECVERFKNAARATADFYIAHACADGIPMWDTGAPNLHRLPSDYLNKSADPFNPWEPVDSSAAAIAAQGLIRLGNYLGTNRGPTGSTRRASPKNLEAARYRQAGLTIARTLLAEPYLSTNPKHQGLLLHSVYHRPNGWDYVAPKQKVPNGESSMWGDYHLRELGLLILREAKGLPYPTFFSCAKPEVEKSE